jgi:hypothetical protein
MKIHIVTVGKPKLPYAIAGWEDYLGRLQRLHTVRVTQLADKYADDAAKFTEVTAGTYVVVLEIQGNDLTSRQLADFLQKRALESQSSDAPARFGHGCYAGGIVPRQHYQRWAAVSSLNLRTAARAHPQTVTYSTPMPCHRNLRLVKKLTDLSP